MRSGHEPRAGSTIHRTYVDEYGGECSHPLDHLAVRFHHPRMPRQAVEDQIRLFGEEVPAFE